MKPEEIKALIESTIADKGIELDAAAIAAIAKEVVTSIKATLPEEIAKSVTDEVTKKVAEIETTIKKDIGTGDIIVKDAIESLPKEIFLMRQMKALTTHNQPELEKYNKAALNLIQKAGYANETVLADGGYAILQPDFEAEIEKLVPNYGVAAREVTTVPVNSNSIVTNKRGSNVSLTEVTTEAGTKSGTKMTISQQTVALREFAGIAAVTNWLVEDQAVDFFQELAAGFAEALAQQEDVLCFTENGTSYKGLLYTAGTIVEQVGVAITSLTWDDLLNAEAKLPSAVQGSLKYMMHRTIWNVLQQVKDSQGRYQKFPEGGFKTPWGRDVIISDVFPGATSYGDANEPYIAVGDFKRIKLYRKRGMVLTVADQATVHDSLGNAINLFEKNMKALRAEIRMVALQKFPEAFGLIGTGTVS